MKYLYTAIISPIEDGSGYYVNVPDLPGCMTSGKTILDAMDQITDAMNGYLCVAEDEKLPIPEATKPENIEHAAHDVCYMVSADTLRYRMEMDAMKHKHIASL